MLNHPMRSGWLVSALLIASVPVAACGSLPRTGKLPNGPASGALRSAQPSTASYARLSSPSAPCAPSSNTRRLTGPVAAYFWNGVDGCVTVTLIDSSGQLSTVTSIGQHATQFVCQDGNQSHPSPDSGPTPGPAYSVSKDRIYWWDGHLLRWLDRQGSQGGEVLDAGSQVGLEFAVSPDDGRIVITTIDFAKWPLHRTTWIQDVGTGANKSVIFEADLSADANALAEGTSAGWPWGWQGGRPVLYDFPLCLLVGGDMFIALSNPRIVDPSTGIRLVTLPKCYGGAITSGGVFCTSSTHARALDWYDWTGKQVTSWALPYDTLACDTDRSPSGSRVLAYCANSGPVPPDVKSLQFLYGGGPALPQGIAQPGFLRWLDDDLVLETRSVSDPAGYGSTVHIWSLSHQAEVAGPIAIPGWYNRPRQWFNPAPPPTRLSD